ncbi:hypothetical protein LC065_12670 [Halobacillus litoralis]|uniref:hypothetical protein n=1 Tax=Halobacillus litoralis TaxID=45668 RepID=UPI001CFD5B05|nr:hypothetical protein [Halobacillus litoralis]WLR46431.1 hypothetical protein LC065_12670 [Halobacillus litoralis]
MLRTGDRIEVFSAGRSIGTGVFIQFTTADEVLNLNNDFLLWVDDSDQSTHMTDISTINIRRLA